MAANWADVPGEDTDDPAGIADADDAYDAESINSAEIITAALKVHALNIAAADDPRLGPVPQPTLEELTLWGDPIRRMDEGMRSRSTIGYPQHYEAPITDRVAAWCAIAGQDAALYVSAGYTLVEACHALTGPNPPARDELAVLAGLSG